MRVITDYNRSMKTSLILDDALVAEARKEANKRRLSLSEVICLWARAGRKALILPRGQKAKLKSVDLGEPAAIDLSCRRDWMDFLDK